MSLLLLTVCLGQARGQSTSGLLAPSELNRHGLERMWFTHAAVDSSREKLVQLDLHVSASESVTIYEVVHDGLRFSYRESDVDSFGRVLGADRARKMAEVKLGELRAAQVDAQPVKRTVPRITLYAASSSGRIHAIDAETGRTRWKSAIGNPNYPTLGLDANDKFVAAINGSTVYLLNAIDGEHIWQRKTNGVPGASPALTETMVFVPMASGLMNAYPLENAQAGPSPFRSHGRALVQPISTGSYVAWPTDRGHLYVTSALYNQINFRLETRDTISAPAAYVPPDKILVASVDGFVYCLHQTSGVLQWRFSAGEPIISSPAPFGEMAYVVTIDGTLFCLNANTGLEQWSTSRIGKIVGASAERLYCVSDTNRLTILDRDSGSHLGSLASEANDLAYLNTQTDRIYLGTTSGVLQCIREIGQDIPQQHIVVPKPEAEQPKRPAKKKPGQLGEEPQQPGTEDPFRSGPSTADPFAPASPPAGEPAAPGSDPFGPMAPSAEDPFAPGSAPAKPDEDPFG